MGGTADWSRKSSVPGSTGSDTVTSTQTLYATTITNYATASIHDMRAGTVVVLPANCVSTNAATTTPSQIGCSLLGSPPANAVCGETGRVNLISYSSFPVDSVLARVCANAYFVDTECLFFGLGPGDNGRTLCQFYPHIVSDGGYSTDNNATVDSIVYDLSWLTAHRPCARLQRLPPVPQQRSRTHTFPQTTPAMDKVTWKKPRTPPPWHSAPRNTQMPAFKMAIVALLPSAWTPVPSL